jgi:hypothetical protein
MNVDLNKNLQNVRPLIIHENVINSKNQIQRRNNPTYV